MKQRTLIILVAILGTACIVLGILLLRGGKQPETADPTPEATATVTVLMLHYCYLNKLFCIAYRINSGNECTPTFLKLFFR